MSETAGWMRVRWSYRPTATTTWRPGPRSHTSRCPDSCSTVKLDDEVGPVLGTAVARRQSEHLLDHRDAPSTSSTTTSGRGRITASTSAGGQGGRGPTQGARRERVPAASRSGAASASPGSGSTPRPRRDTKGAPCGPPGKAGHSSSSQRWFGARTIGRLPAPAVPGVTGTRSDGHAERRIWDSACGGKRPGR